MNEFDQKARTWDENPVNLERSKAIAAKLLEMVPLTTGMTALEFGAGTGILSILLKDNLGSVLLIDQSPEMTRITREKIKRLGIKNLRARVFDLERKAYPGKFDVIFTQLVLHHINDIDGIFKKFADTLKPGGFLVIADLYTEDGSFHGELFDGHNGFDPEELSRKLSQFGFSDLQYEECFRIKKLLEDDLPVEYPIFLLKGKLL